MNNTNNKRRRILEANRLCSNVCDRCKSGTDVTQMSLFNTQMCCSECIEKERAHPKFPYARNCELNALEEGDYNFPGIGLPDNLRPPK